MIFISTDILNPYKREIVSQDHYETLIDFLVEHYPDGFKRPTDISVNGHEVALADYDIELKENDVIVLLDRAALPASLIGGWFITALANLAISVTLSYVANKLFAPDAPQEQGAPSSVYNLNSAQNMARYGSPIPIVYGKVRMYPSMIVQPYYKFENEVEYLYHILCVGQGTLTTDTIYIGEDESTVPGDVQWKLLNKSDFYNIPSKAYGIHITRTLTSPSQIKLKESVETEKYLVKNGTQKVEIDYHYPEGLYWMDNEGDLHATYASFKVNIYTYNGSTYTLVDSNTIGQRELSRDAIQRTFTKDISSYGQDVYVSFEKIFYDPDARIVDTLYIKRVKEIYPNEDFTNRYGDITLLAVKIKATDAVSSQGQVKVNGYFTRTDVGNTMSEVLTDLYTNTRYGGGLSADDLSFPTTLETVNCAYDSSTTLFDAMRKPALAQGYSLYLAGMDVILKKDGITPVTSGMYNEMNILRNSFKAQYLFDEEFPANDGFQCTYIDGNGWVQRSSKYPELSSRPKVVDLFGVVDYGFVPPTGENLTVLDSIAAISCDDVEVKGNVAYVTDYNNDSIRAIDITDKNNLTQISSFTSASINGVKGIKISGNVLYAAGYLGNSITAIDISNPASMSELGTYSHTDLAFATNVAIDGDVAYVAAQNATASIIAIDISNPASMSKLDTFVSTDTQTTYDVAIKGDVAYLAAYSSDAITAIDISTPSSMSQLGTYSTSSLNGAKGIFVDGNIAYVTGYLADALTAIDISDPTNMTKLGSISNTHLNAAEQVAVAYGVAYVTSFDTTCLFVSIDISDPTNMTEINNISGASYASRGVAFSGDVAYVCATGSNLFYSVDISNPVQDFNIASNMAKYLYKQENARKKIVSFSTDIQGLVPQFLDKIMVSHSSLQWGEAGEIYSRSGDNLVISDALEDLTGSKTIVFRNIDGSVSDPYPITITDATNIAVTGMPVWVTDGIFYTIQEAGTAKEFLVISVKPSGETVQIDCVNYDETIYE